MANLSAAQTHIKLTLLTLLNQIPAGQDGFSVGSNLIGPFDPDKKLLRMPLVSTDGRALTWTKTCGTIASKSLVKGSSVF